MANALQWIVGSNLPNLLYQDFEAGPLDTNTPPPGWTTNQNTVDYGYQPSLLGTYSMSLVTAGQAETVAQLSSVVSEAYVFFMLNLTTLPVAQTRLLELFTSSATTPQLDLRLNGSGGAPPNSVFTVFDGDTGHSASAVTPLTTSTTWYVWVHYKAGTGANAICSVGYSTSLVEPTSGNGFASVASADSTGNVGQIDFQVLTANTVIDHVGVSTLAMPNGW